MVPAAGLEPARAQCPTDFKSAMSTNSITQAQSKKEAGNLNLANQICNQKFNQD